MSPNSSPALTAETSPKTTATPLTTSSAATTTTAATTLTSFLNELQIDRSIISILEKEMIDYDTLLTMNKQDLKELNIPFGPRRKIANSMRGGCEM